MRRAEGRHVQAYPSPTAEPLLLNRERAASAGIGRGSAVCDQAGSARLRQRGTTGSAGGSVLGVFRFRPRDGDSAKGQGRPGHHRPRQRYDRSVVPVRPQVGACLLEHPRGDAHARPERYARQRVQGDSMSIHRPVLGWHFLKEDGLTQYSPRKKVVVGEWLYEQSPLAICQKGLHASSRIIDGLHYAPGPLLCRVELCGELIEQTDKFCAQQRRVIAMADATPILHEMACLSAESVLKNITDPQHLAAAQNAIATKREWLAGRATDKQLSAAESAARAAAESATRAAAWSAARAAAESAAWSAARAAAWSAASAAAWSAAWSAARAA